MSRRNRLMAEPLAVLVEDLDAAGRGVTRVDGKVTFVHGALAGERVLFRHRRNRRRYREGIAQAVLESAPERVVPRCAHFDVCGACSLQHLAPDAQLAFKERRVLDALAAEGLAPRQRLEPVNDWPWGYRRRARLGVRHVPAKGGVLVGFHEKFSNLIAEISRCEVLVPEFGERIEAFKHLLSAMDARASIPQIEVVAGDAARAMIVRHLEPLSGADRARLADFASAHRIEVFLQPGGPDSIVALVPGSKPSLAYRLDEQALEFAFEPSDFVQVNAGVNRKLVAKALALLQLVPGERVLDLFCGLGNFSLALARTGATVVGLELEQTMVERARANAAHNALGNVTFDALDLACGAAVAPWLAGGVDKLLLDPPRSGALAVVEALRPPYPKRVVYVSCNPETLARDAGVLVAAHGYVLMSAGVVDMFPHTGHVEALTVFEHAGREA